MANRYCNLVGTNKIKDEYTKINDGFDAVEQEMDAAMSAAQAAYRNRGTASVSDFNQLTTIGAYLFGNVAGIANEPGLGNNLIIEVAVGGGYIIQRATSVTSYRQKYRTRWDTGQWQPWEEVITQQGGTFVGDILFNNAKGVYGKDSGGTTRRVALLSDAMRIGDGSIPLRFHSSGKVLLNDSEEFITSGNAGPFYRGAGSPEGVVTAPVGAIYQRTDGGASSTLYVKESGSGNTGWVAK